MSSSSIRVDEISPISGSGGVNFTGLYQPTFNGVPFVAGGSGTPGVSSATIFLYQRTATNTPPAAPAANVVYEFSTGIASGLTGGWDRSLASSGGAYRWFTTATAFGITATDTIAPSEWATPTLLAQDGVNGTSGSNTAVVQIYQRAATTPSLPSSTATYTFSTAALTGLDNGWTKTIPAGTLPLWVAVASAVSFTDSDTIANNEWTAPVVLVQNGTNGSPGSDGLPGSPGAQATTVYLYQWATTRPADPAGTSTFTWTTASNASYTGANGWAVTVPANPGTPGVKLWTVSKGISATAGTATTSVSWASGFTVAVISQNGDAGASGAPGLQSSKPAVYKWAVTIPAGPTGSSTYTWATSSFDGVASLASQGWNTTPGTTPSAGFTLWAAQVGLTDSSASTTSSINWTTAAISAIGYAGTQGPAGTGSVGAQGASARLAYTKITGSGPLGSTPATLLLDNDVLPTATTWGSTTWSTSVPVFSAGESIWQSDGIYDPATNKTAWTNPYLSSFKVGQLSAISANLGTITSGNITLDSFSVIKSAGAVYGGGSGFWMGYSGGAYKFSVGPMTFDGTTLSVPAANITGQLTAAQINGTNLVIKNGAGQVVFGVGASVDPSSFMAVPSAWTSAGDWSAVTGKPGSDTQIVRNLVDPSTWVIGSSGTQPGFIGLITSPGGSNSIVLRAGPDGGLRAVWKAISGSAAGGGNAEGGWDCPRTIPADTKKTYRFTVWVQMSSITSTGSFYFGASTASHTRIAPVGSTTEDNNPYFTVLARNLFVPDRWYLAVGYIFANGNGLSSSNLSGIYDSTTGQKISTGTDFQFMDAATTTLIGPRCYQYYTTAAGNTQYIWGPRLEVADGSEQTLNQMLSTSVAYGATVGAQTGVNFKDDSGAVIGEYYVKNTNISIASASGNISGIGTGNGTSVANNQDYIIRNPNGALYSATSGVPYPGPIKIRLPVFFTDTMLRFTVEIYEYASNCMCTLEIGGYTYSGTPAWLNCTARVIGASNVEYPVYFGHDGSRTCIWIGSPSETWDYPQIRVRDVFVSFNNYSRAMWEDNWAISLPNTGPQNVSQTISDTLIGADWSKTVRRPSNLAALSGTESINNANITVNGTTGAISGIGSGAGTVVDNSKVVLGADGTLSNAGTAQGQVTLPGLGQNSYRVATKGNSATTSLSLGVFKNGTPVSGVTRSYTLVKIQRSTGNFISSVGYDVWGAGAFTSGRDANSLAADLNSTGNDTIIVVVSYDEPQRNRMSGGLPAAMYRCGASRAVFGSPRFKSDCAYILVGIAGCGEGNGAEFYAGDADSSATAVVEAAFTILNGNLVGVSSSYTPTSLQDYGYIGDLSATSDITLVNQNDCLVNGNTVTKNSSTSDWTASVYSMEAYTGGAYVSFIAPATGNSVMVGLSKDPSASTHWSNLDHGIYCASDGSLYAAELGSLPSLGSYSAGDLMTIAYDGSYVKYMKNGGVYRTVSESANLKFFLDSSIYTPYVTIRGLRIGPYGAPSSIQPNNPLTGSNSTTYIAAAAIKSAMVESLQTVNYAEAGGVPTAGAKMASAGTALKVASGSFQVGALVFTDYWYRLIASIDGSVAGGRFIWRGNNDVTTRGGSPNIDCMHIFAGTTSQSGGTGDAFWQSFTFELRPSAYTDNLDSMRYGELELYPNSGGSTPLVKDVFVISDRLYYTDTSTDAGNISKGQIVLSYRPGYGVGGTIGYSSPPYSFFGHLRIRILNAYGPSAWKWFHYGANSNGAELSSDYTPPSGAPAAGGGGGGGGAGGYCPAPWVKIALENGAEVDAYSLHDGMKVAAVNDMTLEPIPGGGTVRYPSIRWAKRFQLTLANGEKTEWSQGHKFYVVGRGWTTIETLVGGDVIAGPKENIVESILATGEGQVVSFTVEGAGTYFGGGMLAHNRKIYTGE